MPVREIDNVSIAYEVRGEGSPLVFLHCWTGNHSFFFEQVSRFSSEYKCICLDFPGHGESGEAGNYSVESFGEITVTLLEEIGVESAVFAGHSLGGMVCLYLALEHPDLVEGLILLDTTPHLSGWAIQRVTAFTAVAAGHLGFKPAKALVAGVASTHPLASVRSRVIAGKECCKVSNRVLTATLNSARKYDVIDRLPGIEKPALIVVGTFDVLADLRHARKMAKKLPDSVMKIVPRAGHMALFERPEVVNTAIEDFLRRTYPPAPDAGEGKSEQAE
jgi:3-oxoadipate enol-lactonase